jgi:hypothetical protein
MHTFIKVCLFLLACVLPVRAERGRDTIGEVTVTLIHACDQQKVEGLTKCKVLDDATTQRLRKDPRLKFEQYRVLGMDAKPLYRSYENWAKPMANTDDIMVRFEAQARPSKELTRLDLELWVSHKKILKTGAALTENSPMYVLGPEWRQGRMILIISLSPFDKPIPDPSR